jgi:AraC family transcriptional regulator, regulatory protein of adaptative response / DNA-3-methyladenine glycosylase II
MDDFERCYRALQSRDSRFDGWFFTAVTSTHIYCRPSCPALTPKRENVRFYPTAAAAQQAGFRACLRCRPDAAPGSPEWLGRADVAARAVKLVLNGIIDSEGVPGLARRLGYSERQLHRVLVTEVGTGALALARAQRSQTARTLLETTDLPAADVAFAAGFQSVRQFNETVKQVFGRTPTELRRTANRRGLTALTAGAPHHARGGQPQTRPQLVLRLAHRRPFASEPLWDFLAARAVPGVESFQGDTYRRSLRLPHGEGTVELTAAEGYVNAVFSLSDLRDLTVAVVKCRHLLNLDSDPEAVDEALGADPLLGPLVKQVPGRRVAGATDGLEVALRAIVGQQVSLGSARTIAGSIVKAAGRPLDQPLGSVTHAFPEPAALAELAAGTPSAFPMPAVRRRALQTLGEQVAAGKLTIDPGADPVEVEEALLAIPGVGPWTSAYIAMRAIGDPDAFLPTDLGLRRAAARLGVESDPSSLVKRAERWRPWRAYALAHLWSVAAGSTPGVPAARGAQAVGPEAALAVGPEAALAVGPEAALAVGPAEGLAVGPAFVEEPVAAETQGAATAGSSLKGESAA